MVNVKQTNEIYRCNICGNVVEITHVGGGELVCCGQPMELLVEKTEDKGKEKHVPIIEQTEHGINIKVGSIPHPMEAKHYIEWVEIIADGISHMKFLKPGDEPEVQFQVFASEVVARAYCNVHGLWRS